MHKPTEDDRHQFRLGVVKTLPMALGVLPFGLAYGVIAIQAGLTIAETMLMSLIVFAGASQFMAVVIIASGAGIPLVVASTFLVNLRHLVMGLSLSPYLSKVTSRWQRFVAFSMTDESYITTVTHYRETPEEQGSPYFMLASGGSIYVVWAAASLVGALAGHLISDPLKWGIDFAMPAAFLTMLLPQVVSRRVAAVVAVAAVVGTASYVLIPGKWYIILAVVTGTFTGVILETLAQKRAASC
ncbi:MAG: AzlC family ABC transporter permease [Coriobacteriia bacterium]|nr:AzlC family ABC transporter permease [Coriobacteriia bacterium]